MSVGAVILSARICFLLSLTCAACSQKPVSILSRALHALKSLASRARVAPASFELHALEAQRFGCTTAGYLSFHPTVWLMCCACAQMPAWLQSCRAPVLLLRIFCLIPYGEHIIIMLLFALVCVYDTCCVVCAQNGQFSTYEIDFLDSNFAGSASMFETVFAADAWYDGMAQAAAARGITIQYCLPSPTDILQSLTLPAVVQVYLRSIDTYCMQAT